MEKIIRIFFAVCFVLIAPRMTFAETDITSDPVPLPVSVASTSSDLTTNGSDEYMLPYPGILPDHPLYIFKKFRDSILEMLISDSVRKVEFYILQSDKEISAADFLRMKNKNTYITQSIDRAIGFKQKAISQAKEIKKQGKEIPGFLVEKLTHSIRKQADIQRSLEEKSEKSDAQFFASSLGKLSTIKADIDSLK